MKIEIPKRNLPINRCIFGPPDEVDNLESVISIQNDQDQLFFENFYVFNNENKENDEKNRRPDKINRCLFGVPNIEDTKILLTEAIEEDLHRIKEQYGFDLGAIHDWHMERDKMFLRRKKFTRGVRTAKRRRLFGDDFEDFKKRKTHSPPPNMDN